MLQAAQWGRLLSAGSILNIFWKAEAGGSGVQGHICLHSKPQSSLGYRLPYLETKQQKCRLKKLCARGALHVWRVFCAWYVGLCPVRGVFCVMCAVYSIVCAMLSAVVRVMCFV